MGLGPWCCRRLEILWAVLLRPLGVYRRGGCYSSKFWISVVLTILGYIACLLSIIAAPVRSSLPLVLNVFIVFVVIYRRDNSDNSEDDDSVTAASCDFVA